MHKRLMEILSDQKVLYKKQFGFQKNIYATAHAVISLVGNIEKAIDNELFVWGVFVDLLTLLTSPDFYVIYKNVSIYIYIYQK